MESGGSPTFGPVSFQAYIAQHGLEPARTWQALSIDSQERLAPELKVARTMIFRLGAPSGTRHTHFALAKCRDGWSDYFLEDTYLFADCQPEVFIPPVSLRQLFAFQLLPALTETSLVNLAVASGLLHYALDLDEPQTIIIPATGQSTFSFHFRPHPAYGVCWTHDRGQVEMDALFVARRHGAEALFVVEAKSGTAFSNIAKHKLVYPCLALQTHVPQYLAVIPVYLRVRRVDDGLHFYVCECKLPTDHDRVVSLANLSKKMVRHVVLVGF